MRNTLFQEKVVRVRLALARFGFDPWKSIPNLDALIDPRWRRYLTWSKPFWPSSSRLSAPTIMLCIGSLAAVRIFPTLLFLWILPITVYSIGSLKVDGRIVFVVLFPTSLCFLRSRGSCSHFSEIGGSAELNGSDGIWFVESNKFNCCRLTSGNVSTYWTVKHSFMWHVNHQPTRHALAIPASVLCHSTFPSSSHAVWFLPSSSSLPSVPSEFLDSIVISEVGSSDRWTFCEFDVSCFLPNWIAATRCISEALASYVDCERYVSVNPHCAEWRYGWLTLEFRFRKSDEFGGLALSPKILTLRSPSESSVCGSEVRWTVSRSNNWKKKSQKVRPKTQLGRD